MEPIYKTHMDLNLKLNIKVHTALRCDLIQCKFFTIISS